MVPDTGYLDKVNHEEEELEEDNVTRKQTRPATQTGTDPGYLDEDIHDDRAAHCRTTDGTHGHDTETCHSCPTTGVSRGALYAPRV